MSNDTNDTDDAVPSLLTYDESVNLAVGISAQVAQEFQDQLETDDPNGPELDPDLMTQMYRRAIDLMAASMSSLAPKPSSDES